MRWTITSVLCLGIGLGAPARADPIVQWNRIAIDTAMHSGRPLEYNLRAVAMTHVAMFETLNFIEKRYQPHFVLASGIPARAAGGSSAAAAAHHVLTMLYPAQAPALDAALSGLARDAESITGSSIAALIRAVSPSPGEAQASGIHFGTSPLTWNGRVAALIADRNLAPIEAARIHALVSTAIADSYSEARSRGHGCAPCIANPAVVSILEQELGARLSLIADRETAEDRAAGQRIARQALARYRPVAAETSLVLE